MNILLFLFKIISIIFLIYIFLFILVIILTNIFKYVNVYMNNKEQEKIVQKKIKSIKKQKNKIWNEALKIWEIQD